MEHLLGHRLEYFRVEVLSATEEYLGTLDGVEGGEITGSIYNTIRTGGSLDLVMTGSNEIDWFSDRLRVIYGIRSKGENYEYSLGLFLPTTPGQTKTSTNRRRKIELYDKLLLLDQDATGESWSYPAGTVVTDALADLLVGESSFIEISDKVLRSDLTFEPGTSKLTIANGLLQAINYFSLHVDRTGVFKAVPYILPANRDYSWEFLPGDFAVHLPDLEHEIDLFKIPNKVVLVSEGQDETLTSTATNENLADPLSYYGRGRWITTVETGVEAADQETLDALAVRRLTEGSVYSEAVGVTHAWLPVELNEVAFLEDETMGLTGTFSITEMSKSLKPGELAKTTLRRVSR